MAPGLIIFMGISIARIWRRDAGTESVTFIGAAANITRRKRLINCLGADIGGSFGTTESRQGDHARDKP